MPEDKNAPQFWTIVWKITNLVIWLVVPWAVWTTQQLFALRQSMAISQQIAAQIATNTQRIAQHDQKLTEFEVWKNQAPRFTPTDADNLRLRVLNDVQVSLNASLAEINAKLVQISRDNIETQVLVKTHLAVYHNGLNSKN